MNSKNKKDTNSYDPQNYNNLLIGCRIPKDFFITEGTGESDITIHAGSYHLALKKAGIEMCNIMTYSSILPSIANQIKKPGKLVHGSVMETIMAVSDAEKGKRATVGIIFGWLHDKKTGEKYGGLVCEYNGELTETKARSQLKESLNELFVNGFSKKYDLKKITLISKSFVPKKKYGTALVALCFTNYIFPHVKTGESK
jgi:arginine decarboxylase